MEIYVQRNNVEQVKELIELYKRAPLEMEEELKNIEENDSDVIKILELEDEEHVEIRIMKNIIKMIFYILTIFIIGAILYVVYSKKV